MVCGLVNEDGLICVIFGLTSTPAHASLYEYLIESSCTIALSNRP